MSYFLGVDVGTTYTAAAVWRDGQVSMATLGVRLAEAPTVVAWDDNDKMLVGEAAQRRARSDPDRVVREFKRRLGDTTPIIVGGSPFSAEALLGRVLGWVIETVERAEGGPPDRVVVTHPANWGLYKLDLLDQALLVARVPEALTMTEPEAAAVSYASHERVEPEAVVAVFDLGGGTFDAAVLRKTATGFRPLGEARGIERLGGIDFDHAVITHVLGHLGIELDRLEDEPAVRSAVARLRDDCIAAKETLSSDTVAVIPVLMPDHHTEVRLTRVEFERMIRPPLADAVQTLQDAIEGSGVGLEDVSSVLLVGGSSRIPLVAQMVGAGLGRPVAVDAHPKYAIASGAAIAAAPAAASDLPPPAGSPPVGLASTSLRPPPSAPPPSPPARAPSSAPRPEPAPTLASMSADDRPVVAPSDVALPIDRRSQHTEPRREETALPGRSLGGRRWDRVMWLIAAAGAIAGLVWVLASSGGDGGEQDRETGTVPVSEGPRTDEEIYVDYMEDNQDAIFPWLDSAGRSVDEANQLSTAARAQFCDDALVSLSADEQGVVDAIGGVPNDAARGALMDVVTGYLDAFGSCKDELQEDFRSSVQVALISLEDFCVSNREINEAIGGRLDPVGCLVGGD